jgi:hypothetical protein
MAPNRLRPTRRKGLTLGETRYLKCLSSSRVGHFFADLVLINALVFTDFQWRPVVF